MELPDWAVYYVTNDYKGYTVATSWDYTPFSLPVRNNVVVIMRKDQDHNWLTLSGYDYYYWEAKGGKARWWGANYDGYQNYMKRPGHRCVLFGEFIEDDLFRTIFDIARNSYGDKTGFGKEERRP